ncbi:ALP1-like protein isoform X1 [Tanacetum coccineum]
MSPSPNSNPVASQSSKRFSPLNLLDLEDDEFEPLFGEGPSQPVVQESPDESLVEEVASVKRKYVKKRQPANKNDKDVNEPSTPDEEAALCKAWINTFENNKDENGKKTNGICPKVSQFYEMYNSVQDGHESGACKNTIYQKAEKEHCAYYKSAFQLVECWNVLKDHKKWKKVEYPKYLKAKYPGSIKLRTSKSASDSTHNGLNLNDEAADSGDEEIEESRPVVRDKTKRMNEVSSEYLRIKERELEMQDQRRRQEVDLERLKLATKGPGIGNARQNVSTTTRREMG